mgnify:FL=1
MLGLGYTADLRQHGKSGRVQSIEVRKAEIESNTVHPAKGSRFIKYWLRGVHNDAVVIQQNQSIFTVSLHF